MDSISTLRPQGFEWVGGDLSITSFPHLRKNSGLMDQLTAVISTFVKALGVDDMCRVEICGVETPARFGKAGLTLGLMPQGEGVFDLYVHLANTSDSSVRLRITLPGDAIAMHYRDEILTAMKRVETDHRNLFTKPATAEIGPNTQKPPKADSGLDTSFSFSRRTEPGTSPFSPHFRAPKGPAMPAAAGAPRRREEWDTVPALEVLESSGIRVDESTPPPAPAGGSNQEETGKMQKGIREGGGVAAVLSYVSGHHPDKEGFNIREVAARLHARDKEKFPTPKSASTAIQNAKYSGYLRSAGYGMAMLAPAGLDALKKVGGTDGKKVAERKANGKDHSPSASSKSAPSKAGQSRPRRKKARTLDAILAELKKLQADLGKKGKELSAKQAEIALLRKKEAEAAAIKRAMESTRAQMAELAEELKDAAQPADIEA